MKAPRASNETATSTASVAGLSFGSERMRMTERDVDHQAAPHAAAAARHARRLSRARRGGRWIARHVELVGRDRDNDDDDDNSGPG